LLFDIFLSDIPREIQHALSRMFARISQHTRLVIWTIF